MDNEQFIYLIIFLFALWFLLGKLTKHHKGVKERNAKQNITNTDGDCSAEMPRYISHKEVWALQIKSVVFDEREEFGILVFVNNQYANISLPKDYFLKHHPEAQGYYVVYKDGYKSYSPAKVFEEGNSLISNHDTIASFNFKSFIHELQKNKSLSGAWHDSIMSHIVSNGGSNKVAFDTANAFMKNTFNVEKTNDNLPTTTS